MSDSPGLGPSACVCPCYITFFLSKSLKTECRNVEGKNSTIIFAHTTLWLPVPGTLENAWETTCVLQESMRVVISTPPARSSPHYSHYSVFTIDRDERYTSPCFASLLQRGTHASPALLPRHRTLHRFLCLGGGIRQ